MTEKTPAYDDRDSSAEDHWARVLAEAQSECTYLIQKVEYGRISFGDDHAGKSTTLQRCRDCNAVRGELHVPLCCLEECPRCGGQAISCDCDIFQ